MTYRGRFAPSPTGPLHFGSLVAAAASWLDARAAGGTWLVRIEDVDATRTIPGAADEILRTLEAYGLHWDGEVQWQGPRTARYDEALERLRARGVIYRCRCSRREIADSARRGPEGAVYPGTCRSLGLGRDVEGADRMVAARECIAFADRVQGEIAQDLKRRDGLHAYQLAVVVDDADQGITDVVRGADLLWSTPRQIQLQRELGLKTPRYLHVPVATNERGEKLSKQTLAAAIRAADAMALRSALRFLGQIPEEEGPTTREILQAALAHWRPERIPREAAAPAQRN